MRAISVDRCGDYPLLTSISRNPAIFGRMADDYSPASEEYRVPEGGGLIYLLASVDATPAGFWCFVPQNHVCFEVHTVLLPAMYGQTALAAAKMSSEWIWQNTACRRIFTNVPATNRLAMRFAKAAGMTEFGTNVKSYMKAGKLIDQIMLGMSKPGEI